MNLHIHLHKSDSDVSVDVLAAPGTRRFLAMRLDNDRITIYAPTHGAEAVAWARDVAKALTDAADELELSMQETEVTA
jgi:hypothetical protein